MQTRHISDISGLWEARAGEWTAPASLPGTLDENHIGGRDTGENQWHPDEALGSCDDLRGSPRILTRLTRLHTFEGPAFFSRELELSPRPGERVFLEAERSRELTLAVNGKAAPACIQGTVSTPYAFEITDLVREGTNSLTLCCDNSYPSWPYEAIVFSSAATDETQTNWNGVLGYLRLRYEKPCFISGLWVYPGEETADVLLELDCAVPYGGSLRISSEALAAPASREVSLPAGRHEIRFRGLKLTANARRWDEGEGALYALSAAGEGLDEREIRFGVRTFGSREGRLALNGRAVFLRSEANCCVFPEKGHMPMEKEEWKAVLSVYRSYGVNCMRFHSHCPPEAAFAAADEMGMLMQPELSHWNPRTAFEDEKSWAYYRLELEQILRAYGNHPSFVMLSFGNELQAGALGHKRMDLLLKTAVERDPTRLYANGSNPHYGQVGPDLKSGFYTSSNFYEKMIRGTSAEMQGYINGKYPDARTDFDKELRELRQEYRGPVFTFEVGQYEVLPDFDEIDRFQGVTRADNLLHIRERAEEKGFLPRWKRWVEATGELALLGYREEIEAVLRTKELSGISLLGLQDFPGQGTALVGMLNSHLEPKPFPFARPERFRAFFAPALPLALLEKYTWLSSEDLSVPVRLANYSRQGIEAPCLLELRQGERVLAQKSLPALYCPAGSLTDVGETRFSLGQVKKAARLDLVLRIGSHENRYPLWVYPDEPFSFPQGITVARKLAEALPALREGKAVFLDPPAGKEHFPRSIGAQFTTDFWSVGTFAKQEGFMGCCMDPDHPVFREFPTEFHSNWQWWPMCRGRSMLLPEHVEPLVAGLDCYARMRKMGLLLEARVGKGRLMLSSMGLLDLLAYPEGKALCRSICSYMESPEFAPSQPLSEEELQELVQD